MNDPVFWLGLSVGLVGAGLLAVFITLVPAVVQLAAAAASVQKFFDTLSRDLPPTLEALRLTGLEVSEVVNSVDDGVKGASQIVQRVDRSISGASAQARTVRITTQSLLAGVKAGVTAFRSERRQLDAADEQPLLPPQG